MPADLTLLELLAVWLTNFAQFKLIVHCRGVDSMQETSLAFQNSLMFWHLIFKGDDLIHPLWQHVNSLPPAPRGLHLLTDFDRNRWTDVKIGILWCKTQIQANFCFRPACSGCLPAGSPLHPRTGFHHPWTPSWTPVLHAASGSCRRASPSWSSWAQGIEALPLLSLHGTVYMARCQEAAEHVHDLRFIS